LFDDNIKLVNYSISKLHYYAPIEYDDLYQEGIFALWQCAEAYDGSGDFIPHARQRIKFRLIDYLRSRTKYRETLKTVYPKTVYMSEDFDRAGEDGIDTSFLLHDALILAIGKLEKQRDQQIFLLRMRGYHMHKIAKVIGMTESRVCRIIKDKLPFLRGLLCDF